MTDICSVALSCCTMGMLWVGVRGVSGAVVETEGESAAVDNVCQLCQLYQPGDLRSVSLGEWSHL